MHRCLVPGLLAAAVAMSAAPPARAADRPCDVAELRALATPPERLNACARAIAAHATRADGVDDDLLRAALAELADAAVTRPLPDTPDTGRRLLAELDARGVARASDRAALRDVLLATGRLDDAARLRDDAASGPSRQPLARGAAPGQARYWRWDPDGHTMREEALDLAHGTHLVVDSSPGCAFCARAVAQIDADPALAALFRDALWISRPEMGLDPAYWHAWNAAHPAHAIVVVTDAQGWDLAAQWSTPRFRFLRDGRVVASFLGWTADSRAALLRAAREQDLLR